MKLSICVITMNRAAQLKEALKSCISCTLPNETEFVIIDNASTDDTDKSVHEALKTSGYNYYYEKLDENLGVGGGRNYAYSKSSGEYIYMLDDDAVIDCKNNPDFFIHAINILDEHSEIVTLTTQIYDTAWKRNRVENNGSKLSDGLYKCQMFCGGSHFLKKSFYTSVPYLSNKYGYEEIPPSLIAMNSGKINAFSPELMVIHKPAVNKWDYNNKKNSDLLIKGIAMLFAIKKMMYPKIFTPFLLLAYRLRIGKYTSRIPSAKKKTNQIIREMLEQYPINCRIKVRTVVKMFKDFGLSVF